MVPVDHLPLGEPGESEGPDGDGFEDEGAADAFVPYRFQDEAEDEHGKNRKPDYPARDAEDDVSFRLW